MVLVGFGKAFPSGDDMVRSSSGLNVHGKCLLQFTLGELSHDGHGFYVAE